MDREVTEIQDKKKIIYTELDENKEFNEHLEKIVDYPEDVELLSDRDKLAELEQYWSSDELDHFEYHMRRYYEWD